jgi:drug/metabolite transporter superfamily protein YnfA
VALAFGLTQVFPTVQDARSLKEVSGRPILGTASMIVSAHSAEEVRRSHRMFAAMLGIFLLVNLSWLLVVRQNWLP